MYGGILNEKDQERTGNMKITLIVTCEEAPLAQYAEYTYEVVDPTKRRRLLAGSRSQGDCRL